MVGAYRKERVGRLAIGVGSAAPRHALEAGLADRRVGVSVASTGSASTDAVEGARPGVAVDPAAPLVSGLGRCGTGPLVRRSVAWAMLPCPTGRFWRRSLDDFWCTCEADARRAAGCGRCRGRVDGSGGSRGEEQQDRRSGGSDQGRRRMASPPVLGGL